MSRPTKYNEETAKTLTETLHQGYGRVNACRACGVAYHTFLDWLERYPDFSQAVKKAEAEAEAYRKEAAIEAIRKAYESNGQWQAAAWWLERKHPDQYAKRESSQVEHSGAVGKADLTFEEAYRLKYGKPPEDMPEVGSVIDES